MDGDEKQFIPYKGAYGNEDIDKIISLLDEYGTKLLRICDEVGEHRAKIYEYNLGCVFFALLSLLFFTLYYNQLNIGLKLIYYIVILVTIMGISFLLTSRHRKHQRLLMREAKTLAIKLQRLINFGSQLQEHIADCFGFTTIIELDLRITDAESVLEHYNLLKKKSIKSYPLSFYD